ncbi:MAG: DUF1552 domain-containing protein, partial [Planctomycetes bacterium]|nr:DUF1552 domain-containing protein [Planctomycetota bacterium]
MPTQVSRRNFLRAAGVTLAIPWLETSAFGGPAAKPPRRMVCINTPLGVHAPFFFPEKAGKDYEFSPYLELLKDFRNDFTVISGLSHPDVGPSHDSNYSFLTGAPHPERRAGFRNTISLDQFAAERTFGQTRFASLPLSCEGFGLSWTRSGAAVPSHSFPATVFAQLFLEGRPDEVQNQARRLRDGQSILDTVRDQTKKLQTGLGTNDKEKLDEYFTSLRELEHLEIERENEKKRAHAAALEAGE